MNGIVCIDKPSGPSSFAVLSHVRKALHVRKAGHAGTLDPKATGLLVIALGEATKLLSYLPLEPKTYQFGILFGSETDTLDSEGTIIKSGGSIPAKKDILSIIPEFIGSLLQTPPEYSSVKIAGVRAYALARQGTPVTPSARQITVFSLSLTDFNENSGEARLQVSCSGGTYVRSLARDIAARLSTFGYASFVRRCAAGVFSTAEAVPFDTIKDCAGKVISIDDALRGQPSIIIDNAARTSLRYGKDIVLPLSQVPENSTDQWCAYDREKHLVAIVRRIGSGLFHPVKVFAVQEVQAGA